MKRKVKTEENSSLELLLDTMCNTFGGIMFIAILLVILCSMTDFANQKEKNIQSNMTPQQVEELKAKIRLKKKRLDIALKEIKMPATMINSKEVKLILDYQHLKIQLANANIEKIILADDLKNDIQKQNQIETQSIIDSQTLRENEKKMRKLELENSKLKLKIRIAKNTTIPGGISPPTAKDTNKQPTFAVIKSNRLYLLCKSSPVNAYGFNKNAFSNSLELFFSNNNRVVRFIPKAGHGKLINNDILIKKEIKNIYKIFPSNRYFISFLVHADSINSFIGIRKYLHKNNYSYAWSPYMNNAHLVVLIGNTNHKCY